MSLNKKILPVYYPPITSYPAHAHILSILSNNEETLPWFYNHYFQIALDKNNIRLDFNISYDIIPFLKNCAPITFHELAREFITNNWDTVTDFLVNCINSGYYIYLIVDKYYISAYGTYYLKYHSSHDMMIYGYNKDEQCFNIADFFNGGKYNYAIAKFSEVEEAYNAIDCKRYIK